jgi:hypothetical protein
VATASVAILNITDQRRSNIVAVVIGGSTALLVVNAMTGLFINLSVVPTPTRQRPISVSMIQEMRTKLKHRNISWSWKKDRIV